MTTVRDGEKHIRAAVHADADGAIVWVDTSVFAHVSDEEKATLAAANHLWPAPHDLPVMDQTRVTLA